MYLNSDMFQMSYLATDFLWISFETELTAKIL